jgi:hypothetical protein
MTDKAQAKIDELEAQKIIVEKVDEILERVERDLKYAKINSTLVYEKDEDDNPILDEETGKQKYHWDEHEYTEEELEDNPRARSEIRACETIIKALEKLI